MNVEVTLDTGMSIDVTLGSILSSANSHTETMTLNANTDESISNPFTLPVIPRQIQVYSSTGAMVLDGYRQIDQTTGDITINLGATFTNAIINITGW